ncbi:MAG TPA: FAD-dependent oxidoreductase, partial [Noviherbaspirillum sp.]
LSMLFPQHAARHVEGHGGQIVLGARIERLERTGRGWLLGVQPQDQAHDAVVLATPPVQAAALLAPLAPAGIVPAFEWEAITTVYLQYAASVRLPRIFLALQDEPEAGHWGQFVFDRGQLNGEDAGLMAVVVSASGAALERGKEVLAAQVAAQLAQVLRMPALSAPEWSRVISEKRATFACTPDLQRPSNDIGIEGLALAGDYTDSDYPATLESAVRSGTAAARLVLGKRRNGSQA